MTPVEAAESSSSHKRQSTETEAEYREANKRRCGSDAMPPLAAAVKQSRCCPSEQLWVTANIRPGDSVYVKWFIEEDESDEEEEKPDVCNAENQGANSEKPRELEPSRVKRRVVWWEGEVSASPVARLSNSPLPSDAQNDGALNQPAAPAFECDDEGRFIWTISYEALEPIFPAENCRIVFLDGCKVLHLDYDDRQALEFSVVAPPKIEEESVSGKEDGDQDPVITLQEIIDAQRVIDSEEGDALFPTLESFMDSAFNSLPHTVKIEVALKYRAFADKCESFLRQLIEDKGRDHAVTVQEVKKFIRDISQNSCQIEE